MSKLKRLRLAREHLEFETELLYFKALKFSLKQEKERMKLERRILKRNSQKEYVR